MRHSPPQTETTHIVRSEVATNGDTPLTEMLTAVDATPAILRCSVTIAFYMPYDIRPAALHMALQAVLGRYPLLSGRLSLFPRLAKLPGSDPRRDGNSGKISRGVVCSNAGVPLTEAWTTQRMEQAADCVYTRTGFSYTMADLRATKAAPPPSMFTQSLDFAAMLKGEEPLMKVKLTHLADGTSVLAITSAHVVTDGSSAVQIASQLAAAYRHVESSTSHSSSVYRGPSSAAAVAGDLGTLPASASMKNPVDAVSYAGSYGSGDTSSGDTHGSSGGAGGGTAGPRRQYGITAAGERGARPAPPATAAARQGSWVTDGRAEDVAGGCGGDGASSVGRRSRILATEPHWTKGLLRQQHFGCGSRDEQRANEAFVTLVIPPARSPTLMTALCSQVVMLQAVRSELAHVGREAFTSLCTPVLHIPERDLVALKDLASRFRGLAGQAFISTNDAVTALVWLLFCFLRGRPVPGQRRSPGLHAHNFLGTALDMRRPRGRGSTTTAAGGRTAQGSSATHAPVAVASGPAAADVSGGGAEAGCHLPADYIGNAACTVQCNSQDAGHAALEAHVAARLPLFGDEYHSPGGGAAAVTASSSGSKQKRRPPPPPAERVQGELAAALLRDRQLAGDLLSVAAAKVRKAVSTYRSMPNATGAVMRFVYNYVTSSWSSRAILGSRYLRQCDGFLTSWQFPVWDVDFGQGPPAHFQSVMMPTAPWSAVSLPAHPSEPGGGLLLYITVPNTPPIMDHLEACPLLAALTPNATWVSMRRAGAPQV